MSEKMFSRRQALVAASGLAATAAVAVTPASAEFQPAMQAALTALGNAKTALLMGTADKGGHRLAAIALIDQAMHQVQLGIQFDNVH